MTKITIRTDASINMGSGHVMRCLVLAELLSDQGASVEFICKELPGNLIGFIKKTKNFAVHILPVSNELSKNNWQVDAKQTNDILKRKATKVDWMIVDSYALDYNWEQQVRSAVKKIMVIDDLANRPHDCDLLLDQNYYLKKKRYLELIPAACIQLLGPKYILLRKEFTEARKTLLMKTGVVKRILISYGGSDPTNETIKALKAVQHLNLQETIIDVVIGQNNPHQDEIENLIPNIKNTNLFIQINDIAKFMAAADLSFGAGGSTTWERHFLGLPTITTITADNQKQTTKDIECLGTIWNLGWHEDVDSFALTAAMHKAFKAPETLRVMSNNALKFMENLTQNWISDQLFA
jgi:UDP-2,4-diacetamido-2,4,6-trideoxy-beta-L-altropyranose hydrolase